MPGTESEDEIFADNLSQCSDMEISEHFNTNNNDDFSDNDIEIISSGSS